MVHSFWTNKSSIIVKTSVCAIIILMILQVGVPISAGSNPGTSSGTNTGLGAIPYVATSYEVVFKESGLPASPVGQLWTVNLSGKISKSNTNEIVFNESIGTYYYNITTSFGFSPSPASGFVVVSGSNILVNVNFSTVLFNVTFNEKGLGIESVPGETAIPSWGVTFDGISRSVQGSNISFLVQNGTYNFIVSSPAGYYALNSAGTITVKNANILQMISFSSKEFRVIFNETGLPNAGAGSLWNVSLVSSLNHVYRQSSVNSTIEFTVVNGTYSYTVSGPGMYSPNPSTGTITINGNNYYVPVNFVKGLYVLSFNESGLPVGDGNLPVWGVTVTNSTSGLSSTRYTNLTSIEYELPSGSYSYHIIPAANFTIHSFAGSGVVSMNGENQYLPIHFVPNYFRVEFTEIGLPSFISGNTLWAVKMGGVVENSSTSSIYFTEPIPAVGKIITYTILPVPDFRVNGTNTGQVNTANYMNNDTMGSVTFRVVFNYSQDTNPVYTKSSGSSVLPYLVFYETGLPAGTQWSLGLNNTSLHVHTQLSSSYSQIYFNQTKGETAKLYFSVFMVEGYVPVVNASGNVTWNGLDYINISVVFIKETHEIHFFENGLPQGTAWTLSLYYPNGTFRAFSSLFQDSRTINLSNGLYYYQVGMSSSFRPDSTEGSIYVNNSTYLVSPSSTITYQSPLHVLTFYESGLPSSATWSLSLTDNAVSLNATGDAFEPIVFQVPNGTYYYQVRYGGNPSYTSPNSGGYVWLTGSSTITLQFHDTLNLVTFNESGLPQGQSFQVTMNGTIENSNGFQSVTFSLPNGTYYFTVSTKFPYAAHDASGFVTVSGSSTTVNLIFYNYSYVMSVQANGLPSGSTWNFVLDGSEYSSSTGSISFLLSNGTYTYYLDPTISGFTYYPNPSGGYFNISGANRTLTINFTDYIYTVNFVETGLPSNSLWTMTLSGKVFATNGTVISTQLQNGTYSYVVQPFDEYNPAPSSGTVSISGRGETVSIVFKAYMNEVIFAENGIPANKEWGLVLKGEYNNSNQTYVSNQTTFYLPNGTYTYRAYSTNTTWEAPAAGTFTLLGTEGTKIIYLNYTEILYGVSFKESGLPLKTYWSVNLGGVNLTSNTTLVNFTMPNGTYAYVVNNVSGYHITTVYTGILAVNGTNITIKVSFVKNAPPPTVPPRSPTPAKQSLITPTELYIIIIGVVAVVVAAVGFVILRRRRKEE